MTCTYVRVKDIIEDVQNKYSKFVITKGYSEFGTGSENASADEFERIIFEYCASVEDTFEAAIAKAYTLINDDVVQQLGVTSTQMLPLISPIEQLGSTTGYVIRFTTPDESDSMMTDWVRIYPIYK